MFNFYGLNFFFRVPVNNYANNKAQKHCKFLFINKSTLSFFHPFFIFKKMYLFEKNCKTNSKSKGMFLQKRKEILNKNK